MPASAVESIADLCFLFVAILPLGAVLLRLAERVLGRPLGLTPVERGLVAFYAVGAILYVLASIPSPLYGYPLLVGLLAIGAVTYAAIAVHERARDFRSALTFLCQPVGLALALATIGLLVLEVLPIWQVVFPNTYDGGATAVWINLTLSGHTFPWTLRPYAEWGVVYPLGTTVWMTVPVLLLGWSTVSTPVLLLPVFLCLTVPAAFCWGSRLAGTPARTGPYLGLLFAAFFGLVASWPRLLIGGAYDFALALPLLMVLMGLARPFVEAPPRPWRGVVLMGLLVGALTALTPAASELFVLLLVASVLVFQKGGVRAIRAWIERVVLIAALGVAFILRSFIGLAIWFPYPGHVLTQAGNPPYVPPTSPYPFNLRLIEGELDPFVPWKAKLSPFPYLSLELQLLLAAGLALLVVVFLIPSVRRRELLPVGLCETVTVGTVTSFLFVGVLVLTTIPGSPLEPIQWISNLAEASVVLFIFLSVIAFLPLAAAGRWLAHHVDSPDSGAGRPSKGTRFVGWKLGRSHRSGTSWGTIVGLTILIAVPLVSGAYVTAANVPNFLSSETEKSANVTSFDLEALQWTEEHLPTCSRVLVAPGSAAQFLPEFAQVHVVYPMNPQPTNLSYATVVADLTSGIYANSTRSNLLLLNVTEVFVTGQNSVAYPPFLLTPLADSSDFRELFHEGDAAVLDFLPGSSAQTCAGQ